MSGLAFELAQTLMLGSLLELLNDRVGTYEIVAHWQQGEFHHDLVLRVPKTTELAGTVLVVSTNCNGGVKEVLSFDDVPDRAALWAHRCLPIGASPSLLPILDNERTLHWFDPCEL